MNWYEAIYIRKSVRRYSKKAISPTLLRQIQNCAEKLTDETKKERCSIKIYTEKEAAHKVKGIFKVSAPYYMAVFCGKGANHMIEAGYFAERLVLYMTTKGLGTCYQGGSTLDKAEIPEQAQLAIIIAFGYAEEKLIQEAGKAKRHPLSRTCQFKENASDEIRAMLKAAGLAPSALNLQPWRFIVWNNSIDLYVILDPLLKKISGNMRYIDTGIVLCHLMAAADEQWLNVELKREDEKKEGLCQNGKKLQYIVTVKKIEND